jgi:hypothetical protein
MADDLDEVDLSRERGDALEIEPFDEGPQLRKGVGHARG